jgi:hypothetical protein
LDSWKDSVVDVTITNIIKKGSISGVYPKVNKLNMRAASDVYPELHEAFPNVTCCETVTYYQVDSVES